MDYQLAKKLKAAGFPQQGNSRIYAVFENGGWAKSKFEAPPDGFLGCYVPTLEELIEACADEFAELEKDKTGWYGIGGKDEDCGCNCKYSEPASTPAEAVARLWLTLHGSPSKS